MEYAEEEVEQEVDEMVQDDDAEADAGDRTYENDDNEHCDPRESDREDVVGDERGEDAPVEEETKLVIDVPKRMRKDVDEADVEDGEVFDDDEELHGEEGKADGTAGESKGIYANILSQGFSNGSPRANQACYPFLFGP